MMILKLNGQAMKELPPNKNDKVYFEIEGDSVEIDGKVFRVFSTQKFTEAGGRIPVLRFLPVQASTVKVHSTAKVTKVKNSDSERMDRIEAALAQLLQAVPVGK